WLCAHVLNFSLGSGIISQIITSAIGAIILLLIIRLVKRA
ncbi:MAG: GlsB/YeaQ/YmgE family stress response membrane protein, partial [Proteobacteria bacterium]|nr:GlsB/YeaQ/YmgE family stress response membrane protein [Pseudomonadota bacterium]